MSTSSLLTRNISSFHEPPPFPEALFKFIITGYDVGTYSKAGSKGFAFKCKPTACVDLDNSSNPERQEEVRVALEAFDDWTHREFSHTYTDKETKKRHLIPSPLTFVMENADGSDSGSAYRFYMSKRGVESGFLHDILGLSFPSGCETGEALEASLNREFYGYVALEANPKDPTRPPQPKIINITAL